MKLTGPAKARVGIAKCKNNGNMYGVRVDINGDKWTASWSFPIKPETAAREGYEENEFPPDLKYAPTFPGCPYCGKREELIAPPRPAPAPIPARPNRALRLSVTTKNIDDIGQILTSMNLPFSSFTQTGFNCDVLFLNCGTHDFISANDLRNFVDRGGCLYASDLTDTHLTAAFPGMMTTLGHVGVACRIMADVVDAELRGILGSQVPVYFNTGVWTVIDRCNGDTILAGSPGSRYAGVPILVRFRYGQGMVFFTSFHNHVQASDKEQALLQLLVLRQLGANANMTIEEAGLTYGVDVAAIKAKFKDNY